MLRLPILEDSECAVRGQLHLQIAENRCSELGSQDRELLSQGWDRPRRIAWTGRSRRFRSLATAPTGEGDSRGWALKSRERRVQRLCIDPPPLSLRSLFARYG